MGNIFKYLIPPHSLKLCLTQTSKPLEGFHHPTLLHGLSQWAVKVHDRKQEVCLPDTSRQMNKFCTHSVKKKLPKTTALLKHRDWGSRTWPSSGEKRMWVSKVQTLLLIQACWNLGFRQRKPSAKDDSLISGLAHLWVCNQGSWLLLRCAPYAAVYPAKTTQVWCCMWWR